MSEFIVSYKLNDGSEEELRRSSDSLAQAIEDVKLDLRDDSPGHDWLQFPRNEQVVLVVRKNQVNSFHIREIVPMTRTPTGGYVRRE